jgi:DNA-binding NarL/FixJ family response regulator
MKQVQSFDPLRRPAPAVRLRRGQPLPTRDRILLVDDDAVLLCNLKRLLQAERPQWDVRTAASSAAALAILRTEPLDLLVSDIQMPGMDGMALLAEIRQDPALAGLPLIFITARDDRASVRDGMSAGADDYLTKPFTTEELIRAMDARLRRKAQEQNPALFGQLAAILTDRELEVLSLIGQGRVTKEIAGDLDLSCRTVSVHRGNIMRKLDLHNAAALAALATQASMGLGF